MKKLILSLIVFIAFGVMVVTEDLELTAIILWVYAGINQFSFVTRPEAG